LDNQFCFFCWRAMILDRSLVCSCFEHFMTLSFCIWKNASTICKAGILSRRFLHRNANVAESRDVPATQYISTLTNINNNTPTAGDYWCSRAGVGCLQQHGLRPLWNS
jgi:hypothetical protein